MPNVTATIDRHQRDGLYELIRNHLGSVGDLWIALEDNEDYAGAERLGLELGEDLRLLEDIGWKKDGERESFELTMPPPELTGALRRLHTEAEQVLLGAADERQSREEDRETGERYQLGLDACEEVLVGLDARGGDSA
jgi:hypothetical protein